MRLRLGTDKTPNSFPPLLVSCVQGVISTNRRIKSLLASEKDAAPPKWSASAIAASGTFAPLPIHTSENVRLCRTHAPRSAPGLGCQ